MTATTGVVAPLEAMLIVMTKEMSPCIIEQMKKYGCEILDNAGQIYGFYAEEAKRGFIYKIESKDKALDSNIKMSEIDYTSIQKTENLVVTTTPTTTPTTNIINKGTGAGGSKTNKNGLLYEELTDLDDRITIFQKSKYSNTIKFDNNGRYFIKTKQSNLFKCMENKVNKGIKKAHGCKNPDECYIDEESKKMFIIEKKFQQCGGSTCEKIQTPDFKLWQYTRSFPGYTIIYIYCLSEWFKENCKAELEYLDYKEIRYFWGNSETYKDDIINFIINYK